MILYDTYLAIDNAFTDDFLSVFLRIDKQEKDVLLRHVKGHAEGAPDVLLRALTDEFEGVEGNEQE